MIVQSLYQNAIVFAAHKHRENEYSINGTRLPYLVHVCNVAMEILIAGPQTNGFNIGLAVQVALLHDTLEDTSATFDELVITFGADVARGVLALTKIKYVPPRERMKDCLSRIKTQPKEIWAVKLADRISNLQPPPEDWNASKKTEYLLEARFIYDELKEGNEYLAARLEKMIENYKIYV